MHRRANGNDRHYRGYDILDIAEAAEFEEIAYLLVHGKLPNRAELAAYKAKLKGLRGIPMAVQDVLESIPASAHPMDVLRTAASVLGSVLPEGEEHKLAPARDIADRMMASFGSMLLYWYHFSHSGRRIEVETDDDSIGGHFLTPPGRKPPSCGYARCTPRSTSTPSTSSTRRPSPARHRGHGRACTRHHRRHRRVKGPKHGAPTSSRSTPSAAMTSRRGRARHHQAHGEKQIIIGFGHPSTHRDPRNQISEVARTPLPDAKNMKLFDISARARK